MTNYEPVPDSSSKVSLNRWSCEPECCGAVYFYVRCKRQQSPYYETLWESDTLYYEDATKEEIQELREEVIEAANYYNIDLIDIDHDCVWDWEGNS